MEGINERSTMQRAASLLLTLTLLQAGSLAQSSPTATNDSTSQRLKVGGPIQPPRKIKHVDPIYPEEARAAGIAGAVIVGIVIGVDGSVIDTEVLRSIPELDQSAIEAVVQWLFEPTLLNGEPVEVEMAVSVNFTLT
jgi:TonB family protein